MNGTIRTFVVIGIVAMLSGCISSDDFGEPGSQPDKKAQDYAACELEAQKITAESGSTALVFGDLYRAAVRKCMTAKGYATKE
ncbi:MAG: hypothetical protein ACKVRO_03230 [Micropepsaceae bacterium]